LVEHVALIKVLTVNRENSHFVWSMWKCYCTFVL